MPSEDLNLFALLLAPGDLELREEPLLSRLPRPDYIRIKVAYCALCGSDLSFYQGRPEAEYPRTLGHEYFGIIVLVGEKATDLEVGDLVAVDPNYRCGQCPYCKMGASNLCELSEINLFAPRGLSRFVDLHYSYLHRILPLKPSYLGALIEPLSCALHAIELANVKEGERILLLGAGGQGSLLSLALSKCAPAVQIDVYDPQRERSRKIATAFSPKITDLSEAPGDPQYSLVFEASGQSLGFQYAASSVRRGGRIIVISRYHNQPPASFPENFPCKECTVSFSHLNGDGQPFIRAIRLLSECWEPRFDELFVIKPLEDLKSAFAQWECTPYCKTIIKINLNL